MYHKTSRSPNKVTVHRIADGCHSDEGNITRWLNRTKPNEPGTFTPEIGFAGNVVFVFKVMSN